MLEEKKINVFQRNEKMDNMDKYRKFIDNESSIENEEDDITIIKPSKDGLIERVNKKIITEDGRQLL